jgi:hypothetical protein
VSQNLSHGTKIRCMYKISLPHVLWEGSTESPSPLHSHSSPDFMLLILQNNPPSTEKPQSVTV